MAATLQGVLLAICLVFDAQAKQQESAGAVAEPAPEPAAESEAPGPAAAAQHGEDMPELEPEPATATAAAAAEQVLAIAAPGPEGAGAAIVAAQTEPPPVFSEFLEDMKRRNAAESDHRNIMTPEFREFCIVTREHIVCWAVFLVLFAGSYALVARACTQRKDTLAARDEALGHQQQQHRCRHRHRRFLVVPYASTFRARQLALVVAAAGLASALMTAALLVVTVALANAMEHGDPRSAPSWRLWLLPATLLSPGDAHTRAFTSGPRAAHDFPPVLRRLWRYQSVVSVGAAAVAVPLGMLFESTPRRAPTLRRLRVAVLRWALAAVLLLGMWRAAAGPNASQGATVRYGVHYAASVCAALPAVLGLVPRGTWALFAWLRACVGQRHERARAAQARYRRLRLELSRIELRLEQAIGSWKGGLSASDSDSGSGSDHWASGSDSESELARAQSVAELPPAHPGLPRNTNFAHAQHARNAASGRLRRLSAVRLSPHTLGSPPPSPHLHDAKRISHCLHSSASLAASPIGSRAVLDDDFTALETPRLAARASAGRQRRHQRQREREREMERLSRQIKKYHAQLLFVRAEMARTEKSGLLGISAELDKKGPIYMRIVSSLSAAVLIAATALCWLLVVVQVGRGALSAIFVGEPDLTHSFTYFLPALAQTDAGLVLGASAVPDTQLAPAALVPHALATGCQLLSAALLFVVVMFGLLSMGTSVEDSVHPLRFLASSYVDRLLRARQWECLPLVFLHRSTLAALSPVGAAAAAPAVGQIAGNTSRVFFSSSTDLTSFYRHLQRQAAASSSSPNTLLPGGILPEGFFQARMWGRRVFLLFDGQSRPVSPARLLAYVWVVCGLAMTWPSVLRTTGLISERAYVLPIASLVEPLWNTVPLQDAALALEEEELVLLPATVAAGHRHQQTPSADSAYAIKPASNGTALLASLSEALQQQQQKHEKQTVPERPFLRPAATASMCVASPTPPADFSLISKLAFSFSDTDSVCDNELASSPKGPARPAPLAGGPVQGTAERTTAAPYSPEGLQRRISRRVLHQSLAADTLPRILVRGALALCSRVSSHVHITAGYFVWWFFPDLIVPVSPATVDMQLGYLPQVPAALLPVNGFTSVPGHSEWYGMLRRVQLQNAWLPQADDGTPLVLKLSSQLGHGNSTLRDQLLHGSNKQLPGFGSREKPRFSLIVSSLYDASMHGVHTMAVRVYSQASAVFWHLCRLFAQGVSGVADALALHVQDTVAGRALASLAQGFECSVQWTADAAGLLWEEALVPLWHRLSLAAIELSAKIRYAVSQAVPLMINLGGGRGGGHRASKAAAVALADTGVYTVVPSVFLAEFWSAAISHGSPAFQRLRPELWPHLFGNAAAETAFNGGQGIFNDHDVILQPLYSHKAEAKAEAKATAGSHSAASAPNNPRQQQQQKQGLSASPLSQEPSAVPAAAAAAAVVVSTEAGADTSGDSAANASRPLADKDSSKPNRSPEQLRSSEEADAGSGSEDQDLNVRSARKVWSTLDWMLAVYRVVLGILACRSVFGPSRSSRVFSF
ncbi:hypothetical protein LPJ57_004150 [Coemansia sp. RSA 486]|nr:hypothetical protein LPJ57_004150 [Coemansia sp. RSA 486]